MSNKTKKVFNIGVNDANYTVQPKINGKTILCPYYSYWNSMLRRCYSKKALKLNPHYSKCKVCEEWLTFSNFKSWMETQDWQGKELDKDIIGDGTLYSPDSCVFVSHKLNGFILTSRHKGDKLIGAHKRKDCSGYTASCKNPFTGKQIHIGFFYTELEAHLAWKKRKHELACELAKLETDPRIIHALTTRYAGDDIYEA